METWKKSRFAEPEIDIDFSRPLFSEIGVQIKRPTVGWNYLNYLLKKCANFDGLAHQLSAKT